MCLRVIWCVVHGGLGSCGWFVGSGFDSAIVDGGGAGQSDHRATFNKRGKSVNTSEICNRGHFVHACTERYTIMSHSTIS